MADWRLWGDPGAWMAAGVGILIMVSGGLVAFFIGSALVAYPLVIIGAIVAGCAGVYLMYWENWVLLKEKSGMTTSRDDEILLDKELGGRHGPGGNL